VAHDDLYRVTRAEEIIEMVFADLPADAIALVEWPERADEFLPEDRIDIEFRLAPDLDPDQRHAWVSGYGRLAGRVERVAAIHAFLTEAGLRDVERTPPPGRASTPAPGAHTPGDPPPA